MDEVKTLQERAAEGREAYGTARNSEKEIRETEEAISRVRARTFSSAAQAEQEAIREANFSPAAAKAAAKYFSASNAVKPKVGDTVSFSSHGGQVRRIDIVDGNYAEAGDVGMSASDLQEAGAGHWILHGNVYGGIGAENADAPMGMDEKVACGRNLYGSAKNADAEQIRIIEDMLTNDENASDAEMVRHFVQEVGVTEAEARKWVAKRMQYMGKI